MNENYLKALIYGGYSILDGTLAASALKQRRWGWAAFFVAMSALAASIAAEAASKPVLDRIEQASPFNPANQVDEEESA